MPLPRPTFRSRLGVLAVGAATAFVAACDTSSSFSPDDRLWSFVTINALRNDAGEHRTAPTAYFFRGAVSSIPNAAIKPDSCFPTEPFVAPTPGFGNVTYLDAGAAVTTTIGGVATELPRVQASGTLSYNLGSASVVYTPGDSVVITAPGAAGGYPGFTARGKTAEAFTMTPLVPAVGATLPVRWSAASDNNSALILSLQFVPQNTTQRLEIRCAFADDGVDSIPSRFHDLWSNPSNSSRTVVATRLRTLIAGVGDGGFELISTYALPTPTP